MNEQQLIEGCQKRDRRAQKELYEKYSRLMMGICFRYLGDKETAGDVMQDGFVTVFSAIDSFKGIGSFEGWMKKIFINRAIEELRKNDVLRNAVDLDDVNETASPDESTLSGISAKELLDLISGLPPGFRSIFNLFAVEGYSHKEIAEMLGISESTSRSQFLRARHLLQVKINDLYGTVYI
jgi:RNA polymerase sigma factor (sigma-70 family)